MNALLVRNIWAVGRNYAAHAAEMKSEIPSEPFFFLKAGSCIETESRIRLPAWSSDVHHELEMAFWIDEDLNLSHLSLALDLTARDLQAKAKAKSLPWTLAKSFPAACPLGRWIALRDVAELDTLVFSLDKNGVQVQSGRFSDMIFKPQDLLNYVKSHFPVVPSDVLLTGTPEGVGPVKSGDLLEARLYSENREILSCHWDVI